MSTNPLFDVPGPRTRRAFRIANVLALLLLLGGLAWVLVVLERRGQLTAAKWEPFLTAGVWTDYLLPGISGTLTAAAWSVVFAGIFGVVLGLGRLSQSRVLRAVSGAVVEFFRAVPVLLMMVFVYQLLIVYRLVPSDRLALTAVVTALTLYNGAVVAELVRSGVLSLPQGQREAGLAVGLTHGQTLRNVLLPQGVTAMLPALVSQLVVVMITILLITQSQRFVPVQAGLLPFGEPYQLFSRTNKELHLHLFEFTHTENELTSHNFVTECFTDLCNTKRNFHTAGFLHIQEINKNTLSSFGTMVNFIIAVLCNALVCFVHKVEL